MDISGNYVNILLWWNMFSFCKLGYKRIDYYFVNFIYVYVDVYFDCMFLKLILKIVYLFFYLIYLIFNDFVIFYELCIFKYELICELIFMIVF